MGATHPRQHARLTNAVVYFASRTRYCGTAKLFRLLYLFDVRHFQETGAVATGESYAAYEFGPAPVGLFETIPHSFWQSELRKVLQRTPDESIDFGQVRWSAPQEGFEDDSFSAFQLEILANLATRFAIAHYRDVDLSADNGAWQATWFHGRGRGKAVPLELTLSAEDPKTPLILELHREEQARTVRRASRSSGGHAAQRR